MENTTRMNKTTFFTSIATVWSILPSKVETNHVVWTTLFDLSIFIYHTTETSLFSSVNTCLCLWWRHSWLHRKAQTDYTFRIGVVPRVRTAFISTLHFINITCKQNCVSVPVSYPLFAAESGFLCSCQWKNPLCWSSPVLLWSYFNCLWSFHTCFCGCRLVHGRERIRPGVGTKGSPLHAHPQGEWHPLHRLPVLSVQPGRRQPWHAQRLYQGVWVCECVCE